MKIVITLVTAFMLFASPGSVYAVDAPSFLACLNPFGTVIASYDEGVHGIVGDWVEHKGSDKVYRINDDTLIQCFCEDNGNGIQTNWWRILGINQNDIDSFVKQGWTFIPTGAPWGLTGDPYLAKNSSYDCNGGEDNNGTGGGNVLSSSTSSSSAGSILGLAATGDNAKVCGLLSLGVSIISLGFLLKKNNA